MMILFTLSEIISDKTKRKMTSSNPKVGQRVEAVGKDCTGTIAYIGTTQFAGGKWIGDLAMSDDFTLNILYFRINPGRAKREEQRNCGGKEIFLLPRELRDVLQTISDQDPL